MRRLWIAGRCEGGCQAGSEMGRSGRGAIPTCAVVPRVRLGGLSAWRRSRAPRSEDRAACQRASSAWGRPAATRA